MLGTLQPMSKKIIEIELQIWIGLDRWEGHRSHLLVLHQLLRLTS